jgi:hypothetical protein
MRPDFFYQAGKTPSIVVGSAPCQKGADMRCLSGKHRKKIGKRIVADQLEV